MLIHIVRRGDTLYSIARRYGTSVQRIRSDNGLGENQTLAVGQALIITLPSQVYTVRQGDIVTFSVVRDGTPVQVNVSFTEDAYFSAD